MSLFKNIKRWVGKTFYDPTRDFLRLARVRVLEFLFVKNYDYFDFKNVPVIINNYNRVSFLAKQIASLESKGYRNIYIIDNNSTYPPLLEYYEKTPYTVFRLKENVGHLSFWKTGIYKRFRHQWFVYTDSDIVIDSECPDDFIRHFYELAQKYRAVKVGPALRIDDLPEHYTDRELVYNFESKYWENEIEPDVYVADIDTTFALYRPNLRGGSGRVGKRLRVGGPYGAHHMTWYNDMARPTEEDEYYANSCNNSASWTKRGWYASLFNEKSQKSDQQ